MSLFKKDFIYLLLEKGKGKEKERNVRKTYQSASSHTPPNGTWPATQACALTGIRTGNLSVCRPGLNPLSHTHQLGLVAHMSAGEIQTEGLTVSDMNVKGTVLRPLNFNYNVIFIKVIFI